MKECRAYCPRDSSVNVAQISQCMVIKKLVTSVTISLENEGEPESMILKQAKVCHAKETSSSE